MSFNQTQRVIFSLLFLPALCLPTSAHAAKSDYETLVTRNLDLRDKLEALEQKYAQLENERNVLIGHVRDLQREKEKLSSEGSLPVNAPPAAPAAASRDAQLQAALDQMNEKLGFVTQERDDLRKELDGIGLEDEEKIKALESQNAAFIQQVEEIDEKLKLVLDEKHQLEKELAGLAQTPDRRQTAVKARESQNAALNKQIEEIKERSRKSRSTQKNLAIDLAFARAAEAESAARHQAVLAESDYLKANVRKLTEANEALKNTEQKWRQAEHDLGSARAASRKLEMKYRKIDKKLAKMELLKDRSRRTQEEFKALQMLQKEHESLIKQLTSENSVLEARLAKFEAPAGVLSAAYARRKGVLSPADKQRLDMHFNLAVAYDKTGMYKAEEREYKECLRIDPADANVHYNLGILYDDKLNDNQKAVRHYQKYLRFRPMGEDTEQVKWWIVHAQQQQRL